MTLLELLVSLAVGGFGLLALARLQVGLQRESQLVRQVGEATFLGQRRIEALRAGGQVHGAGGEQPAAQRRSNGGIEAGSQAGSQAVAGAHATYAVAWTVTDAGNDPPFRTALVNVRWTDRRGVAQVATLATVIPGAGPPASFALPIPPAGAPMRRPKNRDPGVPLAATDLGDGTSAYAPPGAPPTLRLLLDNRSGLVTGRCNATDSQRANWACARVDGYLVSGYVALGGRGGAKRDAPVDVRLTLTEGTLDACYDDGAQATGTHPGFVTYTCLIRGFDHDGNPGTRSRWSGRSELGGVAIDGGDGGSAGGSKVCRYGHDRVPDGAIDSADRPAAYSQVTESLGNQNFIVVRGDAHCPGGFSAVQATARHQP